MGSEMIVAAGAALVALINGGFQLASTRKANKQEQKREAEQAERDAARAQIDSALSGQIRVITSEVKNHHSTNLRDDVTGIAKLIERLTEGLHDMATDVREVRKHSGRLFDLDREKERRIAKLELGQELAAQHNRREAE